ncbi:hypothetical protein pb186bvf_004350 [Paramecium bursaria]
MRDAQQEIRLLYCKLGVFYIFLTLDVICSTFVEPILDKNVQFNTAIGATNVYIISAIQIIITVIIFIMFCTLLWQTQQLKFGKIRSLIMDFKYEFIVNILMIIIVIVERLIQFFQLPSDTSASANAQVLLIKNIWQNNILYLILFLVRYILRPFYLCTMLNGSMKVLLPQYHKRDVAILMD